MQGYHPSTLQRRRNAHKDAGHCLVHDVRGRGGDQPIAGSPQEGCDGAADGASNIDRRRDDRHGLGRDLGAVFPDEGGRRPERGSLDAGTRARGVVADHLDRCAGGQLHGLAQSEG